MHIGRIQRTLTVEPLEEPVPGHRRPAPVKPTPAPRRDPVPPVAQVREEAMVG